MAFVDKDEEAFFKLDDSHLKFHYLPLPKTVVHGPQADASLSQDKRDGEEVNRVPKRSDLPLTFAHVFRIDNFLSEEECQFFIRACEHEGFDSLDKEYPERYRNNSRLLVKSNALSRALWDRLLPLLNKNDVVGRRPYGFDNEGEWFPTGLNECFKFSRYQGTDQVMASRPQAFAPHLDGVFVRSKHDKSIYTLLIYLNGNLGGGQTNFFHPRFFGKPFRVVIDELFPTVAKTMHEIFRKAVWDYRESDDPHCFGMVAMNVLSALDSRYVFDEKIKKTFPIPFSEFYATMKKFFAENVCIIRPQAGTALVFNHDVLHEGAAVSETPKYVIKSEIMFRRTSQEANEAFKLTPHYQEALRLYAHAEALEKQGNLEGSLAAYLEAQRFQTLFPSANYDNAGDGSHSILDIPNDILVLVLKLFSVSEIGSFASVSKQWLQATRDPDLWCSLFLKYFPKVGSIERTIKEGNAFMRDWRSLFHRRHDLDRDFSAFILDFGEHEIKYGMVGMNAVKAMPTVPGVENHPHFMISGRSESEQYLFGYSRIRDGGSVGSKELFHVDGNSRLEMIDAPGVSYAFEHMCSELDIDVPAAHPLLLSHSPINAGLGSSEQMAEFLTEVVNLDGLERLLIVDEPVLELTAHSIQSGIVVHIGHSATYVSAVYGQRMRPEVVVFKTCAKELFQPFLNSAMPRYNTYRYKMFIDSHDSYAKIARIKTHSSEQVNQKDPAISIITEAERYFTETGRILIDGKDTGETCKSAGIAAAVLDLVRRAPFEQRATLLRYVVLSGGGALLKNLALRFETEFVGLLEKEADLMDLPCEVLLSDRPGEDAVLGGSILAQLSNFRSVCGYLRDGHYVESDYTKDAQLRGRQPFSIPDVSV